MTHFGGCIETAAPVRNSGNGTWVGYVMGIPRVRNSNTAPITVYTHLGYGYLLYLFSCGVLQNPRYLWYPWVIGIKTLLPDYKLHTTVLDILTIEKTHGILILSRVLIYYNNIFICCSSCSYSLSERKGGCCYCGSGYCSHFRHCSATFCPPVMFAPPLSAFVCPFSLRVASACTHLCLVALLIRARSCRRLAFVRTRLVVCLFSLCVASVCACLCPLTPLTCL